MTWDPRPLRLVLLLVVVAGIGAATTAALAEPFRGSAASVSISSTGRPAFPHPIVPHGFFGHSFVPHPHHPGCCVHRRFVPVASVVAVYAVPPFAYASAPSYSDPTQYDASPPVYDQPVVYSSPAYAPPASATVSVAPAAPPPPRPSVVEYPGGRYELRGDGITVPYTWVWIPNPPAGPPDAPPTGPPASGERAPARRSQIYRWTDEQGVLHLTDRWDAVPPQYRTQARPQPS
jgi:uncharacterized protein DUF4124